MSAFWPTDCCLFLPLAFSKIGVFVVSWRGGEDWRAYCKYLLTSLLQSMHNRFLLFMGTPQHTRWVLRNPGTAECIVYGFCLSATDWERGSQNFCTVYDKDQLLLYLPTWFNITVSKRGENNHTLLNWGGNSSFHAELRLLDCKIPDLVTPTFSCIVHSCSLSVNAWASIKYLTYL